MHTYLAFHIPEDYNFFLQTITNMQQLKPFSAGLKGAFVLMCAYTMLTYQTFFDLLSNIFF